MSFAASHRCQRRITISARTSWPSSRWAGCRRTIERVLAAGVKKTADGSAAPLVTASEYSSPPTAVPFLALGGLAQQRYETVRSYMLLPNGDRPQTSVARFLLARVERFGILGLLDRDR